MRSSKPYTIHITTIVGAGRTVPPFISVIHRHFQKSLPSVLPDARGITLFAPVDLLEFLIPEKLLDSIESIEVTYGRS